MHPRYLRKLKILSHLQEIWIDPQKRKAFIESFPNGVSGIKILQELFGLRNTPEVR
ncbi:hypothetical protein CSE_02650 [Caldisericum exile AZM16c01]|uniref:Uncharacterized protein n=1 Tax=Caldisericum exile (strain DSM 21853 / NBRC 104410 / AZM16c01) TaxID=511051 RepID=A0A7U6JE59_CALEA|nr:hypothetical protein CSE_02650 [Caldisericum exile AZM16c01]